MTTTSPPAPQSIFTPADYDRRSRIADHAAKLLRRAFDPGADVLTLLRQVHQQAGLELAELEEQMKGEDTTR